MAYTMSQREIDLRKMAQAKAARLNSIPRMKEDMGKTVDLPALVAKVVAVKNRPAKKKVAKKRRKRG